MSGRSPEPWKTEQRHASDGEPWNAILDAEDVLVVEPWDRVYESGIYSLTDEDARRIVAAINFCRLLSTEFLESHKAFEPEEDLRGIGSVIPVEEKP